MNNYLNSKPILHVELFSKLCMVLLLLIGTSKMVQAQDLTVSVTLPSVGENRLSVCGGQKLVRLRVENTTNPQVLLSSMKATVVLSTPNTVGLSYTGTNITISNTGTGSIAYNAGSSTPTSLVFDLPDLAFGQVAEWDFGLEALCQAVSLAGGTLQPNFNINFAYTGGTGSQVQNSGNFEVVKPALSIPSLQGNPVAGVSKAGAAASVFDAQKGMSDTLRVRVVNAGNGPLSNFVYWVVDHPWATLNSVKVGGVALTPHSVVGDTTFFLIESATIAKALPDVTSPPNNTTLFQFNESIYFTENWTTDQCGLNPPDFRRGARYGCVSGNPLAGCEQTTRTSGMRFGFVRPILTAYEGWSRMTWDERRLMVPGCYQDNNAIHKYYIVNSGTAPAYKVRFSTGKVEARGYGIVPSLTRVSIGKNGVKQSLTYDNVYLYPAWGSCPGTDTTNVSYSLPFLINPGDTLWVEYQTKHNSCSCYDGSTVCGIDHFYYTIFNWNGQSGAYGTGLNQYTDACELQNWGLNQQTMGAWHSQLFTIMEGPVTYTDGIVKSTTNTVTGYNNSWLSHYIGNGRQNNIPQSFFNNGAYRIRYILQNGLDWAGSNGPGITSITGTTSSEFKWTFKNGMVWVPRKIDYIDSQGNTDTLWVEYRFEDFPPITDLTPFNPGMDLKINVKGDCSEIPACQRNTDNSITMQPFFTPDITCNTCSNPLGTPVDCPRFINTNLKCPTCGICEGITPLSLVIKRSNFEEPDNDNNLAPDATGSIDLTKVASQRFIAGDSLRAVYRGVVSASTISGFEGGFSLLEVPSNLGLKFLPLGGKTKIIRGTTSYIANLTEQIPISGGVNAQVVTNISPSSLSTLNPTAGIPSGFQYQNGDTVEVEVLFSVNSLTLERFGNNIPILFTDNTFLSQQTTWETASTNTRYACDNIKEQIFYIQQFQDYGWWYAENLGGCSLIATTEYQRLSIGQPGLDYFPFEYRTPKGIMERKTMIKHPDLEFDRVRITLRTKQGAIPEGFNANTLTPGVVFNRLESPSFPGNWEVEIPITSSYITVIGDTLTFNSGAFLRANFPNIVWDEGTLYYAGPVMRASCATPIIPYNGGVSNGTWYPINTWALDPKVYGINTFTNQTRELITGPTNLARDLVVYGYTGGPNLSVQVAAQNIQLTGEVACVEADVINTSDYAATLSYLTFKNPSGAIQIASIKEITNPSSPITYSVNAGGIVQIGNMPASTTGNVTTRRFEICIRGNNCSIDSLLINVGWDCKAYPASADESACDNPQKIYVTPAESELGMVIRKPSVLVSNDLCAEQEYIVELSSAKIGSLSNINLEFDIPSGQSYIPSTFEYAWPLTSNDPNAATFTPAADPSNTFGNTYHINVSQQNTTLNTTGLPGTLQIGQNVMFVKFRTKTNCNYLAGSNVKFLSWAYNACGELTNYRNSPAGSVQINGLSEIYKSNISLSAGTINPCKNEGFAINVGFSISPNSVPTASSDSAMVVLPPGVTYVNNSTVAGSNAVPGNPIIQIINGQQQLIWDIQNGLNSGQDVSFTFNVTSMDAQQSCRSYRLNAYTFSSKSALCVNPTTTCAVRAISDEASADVTFIKPDLNITAFSAKSEGVPTNQEKITYSLTLQNIGATVIAGATTKIDVYADNGDGELSAGDVLLFTATTTAAIPANTSTTITGSALVNSGQTCKLLAVIDPASSCVCTVRRSFTVEPEIDMPFTRNLTVCSNTDLTVGPQSLQNVTFEWVSYNGGNIGALSPTNITPTTFKLRNISGVNQTHQYLLRMTRGGSCVSFDTLTVTVFPENNDSSTVNVCKDATFALAGPVGGSNYSWTPTTNLSNSTIPNPTVSGLTVNTTYILNYTDKNGCPATYKAKIELLECANTALGDTVWHDKNYNGIQDPGEPGVEGITVWLVDPSNPNVAISSATTDANGYYIFDKIPASFYQIKFILPSNMTFTKANQGTNDSHDSDANPTDGLTHSKFVSNGNRDFTFDAGIIYVDHGDLADGASGTGSGNYQTTISDNGPRHVIIDGLKIGSNVDGEQNGQPSATAVGDDNIGSPDDEDGIGIAQGGTDSWTLGSTVTLPINITNTTGNTAYLKGYVDWNNDGDFLDADELVVDLSGANSGAFPSSVNITVPSGATKNQLIGVRFRLSNDATMTSIGLVESGEIEDYLVKTNCPIVAPPTGNANIAACIGRPFPTLTVNVDAGQTVDWYASATGNGSLLQSGSNTYTVTDIGEYFAETRIVVNGCVSSTRFKVSVTRLPSPTATASVVGTLTCAIQSLTLESVVSPTGGTYNWSGPSPITDSTTANPSITNPGIYTLVYTGPNTCEAITTVEVTSTAIPDVTPTFTSVPAICEGESLSALPTTSNNGITGTWSPALNNAATTTYTFTPDAGQCATSTTLTITVNPNITPTFTSVSPICEGESLSALPTTSNNGINGTWSPALNNAVTTTYTFTPDAGQCATSTTLTITVNPNITPTFTSVSPICEGESLSALPTTSNNGITGTWSPALNNAATTTYTFTPDAGQCATSTTLTITVNPNITPTFTSVSPICEGESLSALPTTSNNGITGTWSPALNNAATTTYTFAPDAGQCATSTTLTITVNPTPDITLTTIRPQCIGLIPQNNGIIRWTTANNTDKYDISTGPTYNGAPYATANSLPALPFDVQNMIPNSGATYTLRLFNGSDNCYRDTTIRILGSNCSTACGTMTVTAVPTVCTPSTNLYDVSGEVSFTSSPVSGTLTISNSGGGSVTFNAPFTSPMAYSIPNLVSNGATNTITAVFSEDPTFCTESVDYNAPASCNSLPCPPKVCLPVSVIKN
jgi:hypothetical protein